MPQTSLFPSALDWTAVRIQWEDQTPDLSATMVSTIHVKRADGDWTAVLSQRWQGVMLDFAHSFTSDVMSAWLYGTPADVLTAAKGSHKAARLHAAAHQYD